VIIFVRSGYLVGLEAFAYEDRISPFPRARRLDFTPSA
jgi:hypothetical protein